MADATPDSSDDQPTGVAAVDRALSILLCFDQEREPLSLVELNRRTGLYKSTILRLLVSLERAGLVERLDSGNYTLGWSIGRLGASYRQAFGLEARIRPFLRALREETGESASFYRRIGEARVCLFREESRQMVRDHVEEGAILPLGLGAAGHVLTGGERPGGQGTGPARPALPAMSFGERDPDVAALAVPVFGEGNVLLGALTVSGPISRLTPDRARAISGLLISKGKVLSRHLGAPRPLGTPE
ncbi:IclR family transcriptional regulator [Acidimangrovimonas pyrenivorans]|uniref:IclR family transcriptional regulator n=1 Tax=Acidimangrovimonas pyrenivorans TaxID=2030798 RepID=A0ABV7AD40_9RHOB